MRIRNLNKDGDFCFGQGQVNYTKEQSSILLDIKMRLNEWLQDCFFALNKGIPWSLRLGHHGQKEILDDEIFQIVSETAGVLRVTNFESIVNERRYRATMNIYTQYAADGQTLTFEKEI